MDALSEVLSAIRLTGATTLDGDFGAPWGFQARAEAPARFHYIVSGSCWLALEGEAPVRLRAGDVAFIARGEAHRLGDAPEGPATPLSTLVKPPIGGELVPVVNGGSGARTRVVSGQAFVDRSLSDPLFMALPRVVIANLRGSAAASHLEDALGLALSGSDAPRAGGTATLARLAELVVIEAIRRAIEATPPEATGWLAAVNDRHVGRALALMHGRPGEDWTVEKLARQVGLSRSALAEHFTRLLGAPPITYLSHWRLCLAAQKLATTQQEIQAIAKGAGYEGTGGFSRAFKHAFGKPPTRWRKAQRKARERKGSDTSYR